MREVCRGRVTNTSIGYSAPDPHRLNNAKKDDLLTLIRSMQAGPFLFLGSGFSRRYVGLDDWQGLLSRFCVAGKPFEYYLAAADGDLPKASGLLGRDFNEHWWSSDDFKASVERDKAKITDSTSALRIEISRHLTTLDQSVAKKTHHMGGSPEGLSHSLFTSDARDYVLSARSRSALFGAPDRSNDKRTRNATTTSLASMRLRDRFGAGPSTRRGLAEPSVRATRCRRNAAPVR